MSSDRPAHSVSAALRQARRAWSLLHVDAPQALARADRAISAAVRAGEDGAEGWARLARGLHRLYYGTAAEAAVELRKAQRRFRTAADRAGELLATALLARCMWRQGRFGQALAKVLPLRDEGLRVLRHEQRGVLLNTIAGCYSALGQSDQAFAYMFEALRGAGPRGGRGFDAALHCNLAHELMQVGDCEQALHHVERGLERSQVLNNTRLVCVLWINRIICLTELGRAAEAMPDLLSLRALPADDSGRGRMTAHHEVLAIAALRAGQTALGAELVAHAEAEGPATLPDERLERSIASALLALAQGRAGRAVRVLQAASAEAQSDTVPGLSRRVRAQFFDVLSEAQHRAGRPRAALAALQQWRRLHLAQAQLASQARYQSAALQTELLRLQHQLDEKDAQRRSTERARAELATTNAALSRKIEEVQALQQALRQQATLDPLTGLFNRRHLNEMLPTLFALARRERQPMTLAIIDLDHFKAVNDEHGHAAGDQLLAAFGEMLSAHCRGSDVACRYGGEEFCLLLPGTGSDGARRKVQSLLRRWRAMRFEIGAGVLQGLTFSAGVADTGTGSITPGSLLKAADDCLLEAKREGRNRVGVSG